MRPGTRIVLVALAALVLLGIPSAVDFYTDWLWFGETGYQFVFARTLATQSVLWLTAFAFVALVVAANLRVALRVAPRREFMVMTPEGPRTIVLDPLRLRPFIYLVSTVAALVAAFYAASQWDTWLFFRNAVPFNEVDPVLGLDVGFYVFTLPFLQAVQGFGLTLVVVVGLAVTAAYVMAGGVSFDPTRGVSVSRATVTHLSLLASALFLFLAFGAWLSQPGLLTSASGIIHGASYVDVEARLPVLRLLVVVASLGAILAVAQAFLDRRWAIGVAVLAYFAVSFGGSGYASIIQRFVVAPNEQVKETPYIVHNIKATRKAFAIDAVGESELSGDALLSRADIERNAATLENVPLWDHQPLRDTFGQIQEIRTYYDFVSVNNDRYWIDGNYRQIMLSARELNSDSLPNKNWINERLTFTHGYGLTLGPVNEVTTEGLPVLFIKNLPPESSVDLTVTEPSIYYGELSNDHVFVRTQTKEFHYPKGDDNVYTSYAGTGGVPLDSVARKVLFSIRFRSIKTLLSNDLTAESRVMFYRQVGERVRKIAPFLVYDPDRYLAIADGRLYWMQDAYTTSHRYPYATPATESVNYIRASVKVVVDAYHGTTTFYLVDRSDPVAATLGEIFPGLLRPLSEMPEGLRTRLRYPQGIFQLQAAMFSTYHMTNPAVFYNKEDQWEIPSLDAGGGKMVRLQPWYTIMKLPGERDVEYIQMLPFTPRQKDNLAAWMVARSDGESYGKLSVFQFPKQKVIFGPRQVEARINQDQVISPQLTLWNQQGSEVIQGTLLTIPIEESLLYIRPLYLRSAGGRIPELKRVIVAYQNQIVMEETLDRAIDRIFPPGTGDKPVAGLPALGPLPSAPVSPAELGPTAAPGLAATPAVPGAAATPGDLAAEARATYQRALEAQRAGDWARYGEEIKRLGDLLDRLAKQRQ
jgi:hypothetical protein